MKKPVLYAVLASLFALIITFGCQTTYYAVWEKLGKEKRHLLKSHIQKAREEQQKASEEFTDVLTRIREIYGFDGGELEKFFESLRRDYQTCENRAASIEERITTVDQIAQDLFEEWENEINEISNYKLKSKSRQALNDAMNRYSRLNEAMVKAKARMEPVLGHLKDYVLYLKHNLNAQAVGTLRQEVDNIEIEVETLMQDIGKSVKEADDFLKNFE